MKKWYAFLKDMYFKKNIRVVLILFFVVNLHIQLAYCADASKKLLLPVDGDEWTEKVGVTGWNWSATGGWGTQYDIDTTDKKVGSGSLKIGGTNQITNVLLSFVDGYTDTLGNKDRITTLATNDMDLCFWLKVEWLDTNHPVQMEKGELTVIIGDIYDIELSSPGVKALYHWTAGENLPWTQVRIRLKNFLFNQIVGNKPYQFEKLGAINFAGPAWTTIHIDGLHWEESEASLLSVDSLNKNIANVEEASLIKVANGTIGLVFDKQRGFDLVGLADVKGDANFINVSKDDAQGSNLWKLRFITPAGRMMFFDNSVECSKSYNIIETNDGKTINFYWNGITVANEEKVVDVHAIVTMKNTSPLSSWRIAVNNRSQRFAVDRVDYPIIANIGKPKDSIEQEYLVYMCNKIPMLVKNPLQDQYMSERTMQYDSSGMQVSSYIVGNSGLYLATHDPEGYIKEYKYCPEKVNDTQVFSYTFTHFPVKNIGEPGMNYVMPYDTVVGVYQGDWYGAAKIYRDWVVKEAVWCKKGPLYQRKDVPQWMLDTDIWTLGFDPNIGKFKEFMGDLSIAGEFIWWQWRHKDTPGFDTEYPDYFPPAGWFAIGIEQFHKLGIPVMPYTNGISWCKDYTSPSYLKEDVEKYAIEQRSGEILTQHANGRNYAIMCPGSKYWQDKEISIVQKLVTDYNVDAIYFDQAGYGGTTCYSDSHGHSIGSGNSYSTGLREMMDRIRQAVNRDKPRIALTTEGNTETVIGTFDGLLNVHYGPVNMIPFFQFVYHDYQICFGRWGGLDYGMHVERLDEFSILAGQCFVWGDQLGWVFPALVTGHPKAAAYLRTLGESRHDAKKFLLYGQMLTPPKLEEELAVVTTEWWCTSTGGVKFSPTMVSPAVLYSAWEAPDGTIGLVFTNVSASPQSISYSLNLKDYGLPENGEYAVSRIEIDGTLTSLSDYKSSNISRSESLEPYSALVLQISGI